MADTPPAIQPGDAQAELETSASVTPDQGSEAPMALPLALVAIDVAGQIRERSPADSAIFGADTARLTDRFVDPRAAQELLARAATDGSAEGTAWMITPAGQQRFQVTLWRQRGGERIRLTAAFAGIPDAPSVSCADGTLARLSQDLRSPLAAAMGFAELIRHEGDVGEIASSHAASIIAAAWRMAGIADDLEAAARVDGRPPTPRMGEIPLARMVRRVAQLAEPAARAAGVSVEMANHSNGDPSVLGDDGMLWSVIDTLAHNALRHAGAGAKVRLTLCDEDQSLVVEVVDNGPGMAPGLWPGRFRTTRRDGASVSAGAWPGQMAPSSRCSPSRAAV